MSKFPLQPQQNHTIIQYEERGFFIAYSDERSLYSQTLTTSLFFHLSIKSWENVLFELRSKGLKGHFDQNPANPKFDLYYSKRKIGIQLADFPKVTPFTRKTPEIHRVEDAKNARPPCWP